MRVTDRLRRTGIAAAIAVVAGDPGQRVELTITRAGQTHTVPVTLGTLPATRP